MLTPYIVKRSEDLGRLRDELSKLSSIERELAIKFNRELKDGKDFEVVDATVDETEVLSNDLTREIEIDEYGTTYEIFKNSSGQEVQRREIPAGSY
jgi:hypothetical protein